MPIATIEFPSLRVQMIGPLHIGTGFARGLLNRTVTRNRDGLVYVPASAIKGKVREACEMLARRLKISDCQAPYPQDMAAHRAGCLVCRIFGAPGQASTLRWCDAQLPQEWIEALSVRQEGRRAVYGQTVTRTQVQLSRKRGMAQEARLFSSEYALEGLEFVAQPALKGNLELTPVSLADEQTDNEKVYYELALLLAGMKLVQTIGGGGSRGAGSCTIHLPETILVDGKPLKVNTQLEYITILDLYQDEWEAAHER